MTFAAAVCLCLSLLSQVSAFQAFVEYCSDINTSGNEKNSSIFQSNGLCEGFCNNGGYSFSILQGDGCWCSDVAPATNTTGCTNSCPGYPPDKCGGDGLYGYIALGPNPSGTSGPSAAASTNAAPSTSATDDATTTHSSSSAWTPTPVVSLETVTGQVRTVTITPTVPPNSQSGLGVKKSSSGGLGTGGAVGLTIGLVALVAIVCATIYFCIRKRRREREAEEYNNVSRRGSSAGLGGPVPSRTMSENSRYVLGTDGRQVVETWEAGDAPGSRRSRLMPVDPRLDPFAPVYQRGDNKSRESVNTIRDDHDYSRRVVHQGPILRATNPDNTDE